MAQRHPSSNRARPIEAPKTQPYNDEQQTQQTQPRTQTDKPQTTHQYAALAANSRSPVCGGKLWKCNAKDSPLDFQSLPGLLSLRRGTLAGPFSFFYLVQNHRKTNNPNQPKTHEHTNRRKPQQRTQAGRPWASRPPPLTREAALDQLVQRHSLPGSPN